MDGGGDQVIFLRIVEKALAQLGLERDDVSVELIERAKSGFLGLGSSPARIRVSYEAPEEEEAAPAPAQEAAEEAWAPAAAQSAAPAEAAPAQEETPAPRKAEETDETAARIEQFLSGLLEHMGSDAVPHAYLGENYTYQVDLVGEDLGFLIGRRGETLDAIQHLTNYAINRDSSKRARINVDAENYRRKREESLKRLAQKVAGKVVKYRRSITLEPMNAYERHVIHATLQDYPDVTTHSTGTEPGRRVVVSYSKYQDSED